MLDDYLTDKIIHENYTIRVYQDPDPMSPREDDNLGTMTCFHRDYDLGDKHDMTPEDLIELVKNDEIISLPLYILDHSGLWMRTGHFVEDSQGWDTSMVGYIYVTRDKIKSEYNAGEVTQELEARALTTLRHEVETYSLFLSGQVYDYTIDNPEGENIESCCGFYDTEYMLKECKDVIKSDIVARVNERACATRQEVELLTV
jgi:hypothetical protein